MRIDLTTNPGEVVHVYLNGAVVAEIVAGEADTRDDLIAEVRRARYLQNWPRIFNAALDRIRTIPNLADHLNPSPAAKQQQFVRGLLDGLEAKLVAHSYGETVPKILPEHSPAYESGYEFGDALRRCRDGSEPQAEHNAA